MLAFNAGNEIRYGYAAAVQKHTFYTNSGTAQLHITNDDKVGIGTTTPAEKLTVEGNISGSGDVNIVGDVTASAFVGDGSALTNITAEWDGSHNGDAEITGSLVISGSSADLTVTGDINVGPNNAQIKANGDDLELKTDFGNNYVNIVTNGGNNTVAKIGVGTWMKYGFYTGMSSIPSSTVLNTHRVVIQGSGATSATTALLIEDSAGTDLLKVEDGGNVGIGTSSPSARLHISGSSTGDTVLIENNEGSSDAAPVVTLYRNSATPADGDYLGQLKFKGENDTGGEVVYAKITGKTSDVTNGTEDGLIETGS